ncbi:GIY-YIG nuclease family protein [Stenotrophomonas pigmentata]|uniref:GIY-YIG nuclease family protein n=1 Tax=Stenotrophomonas pigmentata TaxID=3055080 RepID=UPI0026EE73A6|nr:GIY-YIG nuclease family protein [Stenotrophomonas sp. 610A2]
MSRRIVPFEGLGTGPRGRTYLYAFPVAGEDFGKLGIARDPLVRLQAFSRRYYDFFDLTHGWLVEAESIGEARGWETRLKRLLRLHAAPAPIEVPSRAGGSTEWFRGASQQLVDAREQLAAEGFRVHAPLSTWVADQLLPWRDQLDGLERRLVAQLGAVENWPAAWAHPLLVALRDALDACAVMRLSLDGAVSPALQAWHRRNSLSPS